MLLLRCGNQTKMKKTAPIRNDYDDDIPYILGGKESIVVFEEDPPPPQFIGLLDQHGKPIYRLAPPRPPIGFHTHPDDAYLYDINPDTDFIYSSEMDGPTDGED